MVWGIPWGSQDGLPGLLYNQGGGKLWKVCNFQNILFFFAADRKSSSGTGYDGGTVNSVTGEGGQRRTGKTNTQTKNHWGVKQRPGVQDPGVDCREKKEGK